MRFLILICCFIHFSCFEKKGINDTIDITNTANQNLNECDIEQKAVTKLLFGDQYLDTKTKVLVSGSRCKKIISNFLINENKINIEFTDNMVNPEKSVVILNSEITNKKVNLTLSLNHPNNILEGEFILQNDSLKLIFKENYFIKKK